MASFILEKIIVENFRGIGSLSLTLSETEPTMLIGPNNSGKTTLLDAIGLCLSSPKFYNYSVVENDFWKNGKGESSDSFEIKIMIKSKNGGRLPAVRGGVGSPVDVYGVKAIANKEDMSISRYLLNSSGEVILLNRGAPISKSEKEIYKGMNLSGRRYARFSEIQSQFPEIWQLEPDNLFVSLYEWKSGPLQRLLKIYKEKLLTEEWTTSNNRKMPDSLRLAYNFLNDIALKTPFWRDKLMPKFNEKFKDYLGSNTDVSVTPSLNPIESWLTSEFVVNVCPSKTQSPINCKRLGDGWQSILRLICLEMFSELNGEEDVILLMEEPETYLHPHLRRKMKRILSSFQANGSQVIVSTHSQDIVGFSENQKIVRLNMTDNGSLKYEYATSSVNQKIKDDEIIFEKGNNEIVFASKVVLTEGKSDKFAVKIGLDKNDFDCDSESVTVADCGSVDNIPLYVNICKSLGIPWFVIHDNDKNDKGERKKNTQRERDKIDAILSKKDKVGVWDNSLEDVLDYSEGEKALPKSINRKIGNKSWVEIKADASYNNYVKTIEEILMWLK